eukprot:gene1532-biopygen15366
MRNDAGDAGKVTKTTPKAQGGNKKEHTHAGARSGPRTRPGTQQAWRPRVFLQSTTFPGARRVCSYRVPLFSGPISPSRPGRFKMLPVHGTSHAGRNYRGRVRDAPMTRPWAFLPGRTACPTGAR